MEIHKNGTQVKMGKNKKGKKKDKKSPSSKKNNHKHQHKKHKVMPTKTNLEKNCALTVDYKAKKYTK